MSSLDPTGTEHAGDDTSVIDTDSTLSYEEISGMTNAELGLSQPYETAPKSLAPEAAPAPQAPAAPGPKLPLQPLPVIRKAVSGCYSGRLGDFQVELRVDVDRGRPMKRVSGDFYQQLGRTLSYFGSFVVDSPVITTSATQVSVKGMGRFTFAAGAPLVQVTIPRVSLFKPEAAATLQFYTTAGAPGAAYHCGYSSLHFRSVRIETDWATDIPPPLFSTYNTGSLPSGGNARNLGVVGAYAEAGIAMLPTGGNNAVDISAAGSNTTWSNAELHTAMQTHFSLWKDEPQWCVWQLAARQHDLGTSLLGIMFDQEGKQRQGCAVFYAGISGTQAERERLQLYTYVHELGHCFNLMHSWQKSFAIPAKPDRPDALSWMNYPWNYPKGGPSAFWGAFDFRFDDEELIHLRHGFRNDVVMGANNFRAGASLGRDVLADAVSDESGLALAISTHQASFALGEPVVLQIKLRATDTRGRRAHTWLHPNYGLVRIVISQPGGKVCAYEPMIDHLVAERQTTLGVSDEIEDSAYIGYGKGGFYFDHPGLYRVRAAYAALDGSQVLSDILTVRVRYPVSEEDNAVADLMIGEDQGKLLYLQGSDNPALQSGNDAFDEVLDRFDSKPIASYVRMCKGINAARDFKQIGVEGAKVASVRAADTGTSVDLLTRVHQDGVLDPVTGGQVAACLAEVQAATGDDKGAAKTLQEARAQTRRKT